jgi:hypothetical protein
MSQGFLLASRMSYFPFRGVVSLLCHPEDKRLNVILSETKNLKA